MRVTGWIKDGHFLIDIDVFPGPKSSMEVVNESSRKRSEETGASDTKEPPAVPASEAPSRKYKERKKKDHRPAIRTAISELQAKKSKVNLSRVRRHLGWGSLGGGDRRRLQIKEVLAELGIETKYGPRKAVSTPAQTLPVMEIAIRSGEIVCPQDAGVHLMERCSVHGKAGVACPYFVSRDVDSNGYGTCLCRYSVKEGGTK